MSRLPLPEQAREAVQQVGRYGQMAAVVLRTGVVPTRPDQGVRLLPSLLRWGTTLAGLYSAAAAAVPDRPAVIDDDREVTFRQLDDRVTALAAGLAAEHQLAAGDAIGLLARNHIGFVETLLACGRLGVHVILLNTGMSPAQAAVVADQQGLALLVVDTELADKVAEVDPTVTRLWCGRDEAGQDRPCTDDLVRTGARQPTPPKPDEPGRTVVMTSGTTGAPKGARRPASGGIDALAAIVSRIPLRADECAFIVPPLFHTWGYANLQLAGAMRSTVVLRRRFDPEEAMRVVATHRCTSMAVVPVMLQRILELEDPPQVDTSQLRIVASSGSALPGPLATRWMDVHGDTLYNLYGSTEVSWATIATPEDLRARPGTAGRPPLGTALRILDDDGHEVPTGEVGRIFVGNDLHFEGYTGDVPGKEVRDGLMATGDVGHLDEEGRLFVSGRDDDMIVSGGENVFPKEVEDLLSGRDDVRECAVIGVPDEEFGQRMVAFVVRTDPSLDEEAVKAHVKAHLASFSVPREVHFIDELPRNPTGKVVPRDLRAMLGN